MMIRKLDRNCLAGLLSMASGYHVWPRRRITWSQVLKSLDIIVICLLRKSHLLQGKPQASETIEISHQVISNLSQTYNLHKPYIYDTDSWMGILAAAAFLVRSKYHRNRGKSPGQIKFGRYMILPINHILDWKYICESKIAQIDKYLIWKKI